MAKPSILVTYKLPSSAIEPLAAIGEVEVYREGVLSKDELIRRVRGKQALVVAALDKIDKDVIDAGSELRIIANVAVGYNNLDVAYARSKGIVLTNTPDVLTEATANMAMTLILAVTRRIVEGDRVVRRGEWRGFALDFMIDRRSRPQLASSASVDRRSVAERLVSSACGSPITTLHAVCSWLRKHVVRPVARHVRCRLASRPVVAGYATSHRSNGIVADEALGISHQHVARSGCRRRCASVGVARGDHQGRRARRL